MAKVVAKLFRDPKDAERAAKELEAQGYKNDDIQVISNGEGSENLFSELIEKWGISEDAAEYYRFGVSTGAAVVGVVTDESRAAKVREILRSSDTEPIACQTQERAPGFNKADRMSATNPIDAKMTGDFRRY